MELKRQRYSSAAAPAGFCDSDMYKKGKSQPAFEFRYGEGRRFSQIKARRLENGIRPLILKLAELL